VGILMIVGGYFVLSKQLTVAPVVSEKNNTQENPGIIDKTPVDALNWVTYRNEAFGFEMQVPSDIIVKFEEEYGYSIPKNKLVYFVYNADKYFEVRLESADGKLLDDYKNYTYAFSSRQETTLADQRAVLFYQPAYGEGGDPFPEHVQIVTVHNGYFYAITFFEVKKLSAIEKKILSTFKFTK
ncbi:MAG: hypothetical protein AAB704_01565, partial [Patescibacteria group bacterium]